MHDEQRREPPRRLRPGKWQRSRNRGRRAPAPRSSSDARVLVNPWRASAGRLLAAERFRWRCRELQYAASIDRGGHWATSTSLSEDGGSLEPGETSRILTMGHRWCVSSVLDASGQNHAAAGYGRPPSQRGCWPAGLDRRPRSTAQTATCARDLSPSLLRMLATCRTAVASAIIRSLAISRLVQP